MSEKEIRIDEYRGRLEEALRLLADRNLTHGIRTVPLNHVEPLAGKKNGKIHCQLPAHIEIPDLYRKRVDRKADSVTITCPINAGNLVSLKSAGVRFLPKLEEEYHNAIERGIQFSSVDVPTLKGELYDFQKKSLAFVDACGGNCLLGLEPGLGKTAVSLAYLEAHPEIRPAIVVCPAHLKINWLREAQKWMPKPQAGVLYGQKPRPIPDDIRIIILNYDILKFWVPALLETEPQILILDEVQAIKEPKTQRTKAVRAVAKPIPRRLALSGTPVVNRPSEFFPTLNLIDPENFPSFQQFVRRYTNLQWNGYRYEYRGVQHAKELHTRLTNSIMIRMTKEEVLPQLAHKDRIVVPLELTNRSEYDSAVDDLMGWVEANKGIEAVQTAAQAEALTRIQTLKNLAWEGKKKAIVSWAKEFLDDCDESLILFAHHKTSVAYLAEALREYGVVKVVGGMSSTAKQKSVDRFQAGAARVFIGSLAAKEGLTLTRASTLAFCELWWTPGSHAQAEDRCLLKGTLIYCLPSDTLSKNTERVSPMIKNIEDVQIGDYVLGSSGKWRKVTDAWSRVLVEKPSNITTIDYTGALDPIECTPDHSFLIKRGKRVYWEEAHKILPGDHFVMPRPESGPPMKEVHIKEEWHMYPPHPTTCVVDGCCSEIEARGMCRIHYREAIKGKTPEERAKMWSANAGGGRYKRIPDVIEIDNEWLALFGWFVAEGFSSISDTKGNFISLSGHEKERPILERFGAVFSRFGISWNIYSNKTTKAIELRAFSGDMALWFRDWFGHLAHNKSLPREIMMLPEEQARIFLDSYIEGDGHCRKNQASFCSVSPTMAYQMCLLAAKCGFRPLLKRAKRKISVFKNKKYKTKNAYTGTFSYTEHTKSKWITHRVRSVSTGRQRRPIVYDLTVEEDASFLTGFAVAHNCLRIGQKANVVEIYYLVGDESIDLDILRVLDTKRKVLTSVLDGRDVEEHELLTEILGKLTGRKK